MLGISVGKKQVDLSVSARVPTQLKTEPLAENTRRWRLLGAKRQLEVVDDPVHSLIIGDEGDDLHRPSALGTDYRVDFINLANHLGPALGRDAPELVLNNPERTSLKARLLDLPPVGVGVQAKYRTMTWPLSGMWEVTRAFQRILVVSESRLLAE